MSYLKVKVLLVGSSSGKVWVVLRIQHICNTTNHKYFISGLFSFSKRSQRDSYICDGRNMERTPEFTRGVLFMFLPS